jgi:hypothetical protein
MKTIALWLALVVAGVPGVGAARTQGSEGTMDVPHFVVLPHMGGSLALPSSRISSAWFQQASAEKPSQVRIVSSVLSEAKPLAGTEAEAVWATIHDGPLSALFVFTSHMQGTLAIPRAQIHTAFFSEQDGKAQLRLVYEGDPSGKTISGDEASRIWLALTK